MTEANPYRDVNPYDTDGKIEVGPGGAIQFPPGQTKGWVGHVVVVGWLLILSGLFSMVLAVGFIVAGIKLPVFIAAEAAKNPDAVQGMDPEQVATLVRISLPLMGIALAAICLLGIVAGVQMIRFRARTLGIVALSAGFFSMITGFYCFPVWLPVGIYGLVVMLNPQVKRAFELRTEGCTSRKVKDAFRTLPKK